MHEIHSDIHFSKTRLAQYLGFSVRKLDYLLTGSNPPPGFKINKSWLFKRSEIDRWLEQFRAESDLDKFVNETLAELGAK